MNRKNILAGLLMVAVIFAFQTSCMDGPKLPGREYMPDMAHSAAYETYAPNPFFPDSTNAGKPVKGTIPIYRGIIDYSGKGLLGTDNPYHPFHYPNTPEGYEAAGNEVKNPFANPDTATLSEGKRLFGIYCAICHGFDGKASGHIVVGDDVSSKFPPPPSYFSAALLHLPEGKMFFTVHYGKNLMGSYATQLDQIQIWKVITYIKSLQADYIKSQTATASSDTTKSKKK
jgi:mono/diheme cytochrome c family protein